MKINLDEKRASKGKAHPRDRSDNVNAYISKTAPLLHSATRPLSKILFSFWH